MIWIFPDAIRYIDRVKFTIKSELNFLYMANEGSLVVVTPLFNDWDCLYKLVEQVETALVSKNLNLHFVVVNDCSNEKPNLTNIQTRHQVTILNLVRNLGHQKAIAVGLSWVKDNVDCENVIVMDVDGEDDPAHLNKLLEKANDNKGVMIFAQRSRRSEGWTFRLFYKIYKFLFSLLTGQKISFGNFCLIPHELLPRLTFVSEIWNHFSGGVIRSKTPFKTISLDRGQRFFGSSKMNFISLVLHGLSAVSIYTDVMAVRLIIFTIIMIITAIIGILGVVMIKLFTQLAIPGWSTNMILALAIIIFQAFLIGLFMVFFVLSNRTNKHFIPALEYQQFIQLTQSIKQ